MNPLQSMVSDSIVQAFGWMIIHSLWQVSGMAIIVGIILLILRKQPSRLRYAVSISTLPFLLILAAMTFVISYQRIEQQQEQLFAAQDRAFELIDQPAPATTAVQQRSAHLPAQQTTPATAQTPVAAANLQQAVQTADAAPQPLWKNINLSKAIPANLLTKSLPSEQAVKGFQQQFQEYFGRHLPLIVTIWLLGVVLLTLKFIGSLLYAQRMKHYRTAPLSEEWLERMRDLAAKIGVNPYLRSSIELVESALTRVPLVIGSLKPVILLPVGMLSGLTTEQVEMVLAHELAHIARRDYLINILQSLLDIIFFFHPAMWWLSRVIRDEREHCCDDLAVTAFGNSNVLAHALVTLQDKIFESSFGLQPAMAATGRGEGQLLRRIKRLMGLSTTRTRVSSGTVIACLLLCTVSVSAGIILRPVVERTAAATMSAAVGFVEKPLATVFISDNKPTDSTRRSAVRSATDGRWKAKFRDNSVALMMQIPDKDELQMIENSDEDWFWGRGWNNSFYSSTLVYSEFEQLTATRARQNGELRFMMKKPQGTFTFTGIGKNGRGAGTYTFTPDPAYIKTLETQGFKDVHPADLQQLAYTDIKPEQLKELGGLGLTLDETISLSVRGIKAEYVKTAKQAGLNAEEIEDYGVRGIKPDYVKTMKAAGFEKDDIEDIGVRGISAEKAIEMKKAGFDGDEIADFGVRGIKADYVKAMKEAGFSKDDIEDIGVRGISVEKAVDLKKAGFTADEIEDFGVRGIKADYAKAMKEAGFSKDDIEDIGVRGISVEKAKELKKAGFTGDEIADLGVRGLRADYVASMKSLGFALKDLMDIGVRGISVDLARDLKQLGLNASEISELGVRGIKAEYIKDMKQAGFSMDDISELGVVGIKPSLAKSLKELGYTTDEIREYGVLGLKPDYIKDMKQAGFTKAQIKQLGVLGIKPDYAKTLQQQGFTTDEIKDIGAMGVRGDFAKELKTMGFSAKEIGKLGSRGVKLSTIQKMRSEGLSTKKIIEILFE